jgi:hypothetical protein
MFREILQRLGCFLKDKPGLEPHLYRSRQKALKMHVDPKTREDFLALERVMADVAILPEYVESQFSSKENKDAEPFRRPACCRRSRRRLHLPEPRFSRHATVST